MFEPREQRYFQDSWISDPGFAYVAAYKNAADVLIDAALAQRPTVKDGAWPNPGLLVYPIAFLYRQYVELAFKHIVLEIDRYHYGRLPPSELLERLTKKVGHDLTKGFGCTGSTVSWSGLKTLSAQREPWP